LIETICPIRRRDYARKVQARLSFGLIHRQEIHPGLERESMYLQTEEDLKGQSFAPLTASNQIKILAPVR